MKKFILAALSIFTLNCDPVERETYLSDINPSHSDMTTKSDMSGPVKELKRLIREESPITDYMKWYDVKLNCSCKIDSNTRICVPYPIIVVEDNGKLYTQDQGLVKNFDKQYCGSYMTSIYPEPIKQVFYKWDHMGSEIPPSYQRELFKPVLINIVDLAKEGE